MEDTEAFGDLYEGVDIESDFTFSNFNLSSDDDEHDEDDLQILVNDETRTKPDAETTQYHSHQKDFNSNKVIKDTSTEFKANKESLTRRSNDFGDFWLPLHKTIFDVDIDKIEVKKWRAPGANLSDFFNFDLDEESWKLYFKQMEQQLSQSMELSSAMPLLYESRIYTPDKEEVRPSYRRHELPTGKPIQVETGIGDRLPTVDVRRPRIRDSDVVIKIHLHDAKDKICTSNDTMSSEHNRRDQIECSAKFSSMDATSELELENAILKNCSEKGAIVDSVNGDNEIEKSPGEPVSNSLQICPTTESGNSPNADSATEHGIRSNLAQDNGFGYPAEHRKKYILCHSNGQPYINSSKHSDDQTCISMETKGCNNINTNNETSPNADHNDNWQQNETMVNSEGLLPETAADNSFIVKASIKDDSTIKHEKSDPFLHPGNTTNEVLSSMQEALSTSIKGNLMPPSEDICSRKILNWNDKEVDVNKHDIASGDKCQMDSPPEAELKCLQRDQDVINAFDSAGDLVNKQKRSDEEDRLSEEIEEGELIESETLTEDESYKNMESDSSEYEEKRKNDWQLHAQYIHHGFNVSDKHVLHSENMNKADIGKSQFREREGKCQKNDGNLSEKSWAKERANPRRQREKNFLRKSERKAAYDKKCKKEDAFSHSSWGKHSGLKSCHVVDRNQHYTDNMTLPCNDGRQTLSLHHRMHKRSRKHGETNGHLYYPHEDRAHFHDIGHGEANAFIGDGMEISSYNWKHCLETVSIDEHHTRDKYWSHSVYPNLQNDLPLGKRGRGLVEYPISKICTCDVQDNASSWMYPAKSGIMSSQIPVKSEKINKDYSYDFGALRDGNGAEGHVNKQHKLLCSVQNKQQRSMNDHAKNKIGDSNQTNLSPQLLEALAKLEKRRERFKQPLATGNRNNKTNNENNSGDVPQEQDISEVKQQRPARKRKWGLS